MRVKSGTHDARRIIGCNDDILQSELVQIERVPSQLWIGTVEALAASNELDKQRDGALDDGLRLREQGLVLGSRRGTLCKKRAGRSALTLGTSEEVRARCWEWTTVNRERGAAFDVEARVREWAEGRKGRRWVCWRRRGRRIAWFRENDGADGREEVVRQLDHELRELRDQRVLRLRGEVLEDCVQTHTRDLHASKTGDGQSDKKQRRKTGIRACLFEEHMRSQLMGVIELIGQDFGYRDRRPFSDPLHRRNLFANGFINRESL